MNNEKKYKFIKNETESKENKEFIENIEDKENIENIENRKYKEEKENIENKDGKEDKENMAYKDEKENIEDKENIENIEYKEINIDNSSNIDDKQQGSEPEQEILKINDTLQETIELSILYDFYGDLLKDKSKEVFTEYVFNDLSLAEIAEEKEITRQGVHDIIKRTSKKLREYEDSLHLIKKFRTIELNVNRIKELTEELEEAGKSIDTKTIFDEIKDLSDDILQNI